MSRSAKPHHRNRVDASVSGGERQTPAADDDQERRARLLLLAKGAALAHPLARPRAAESDEYEQQPTCDAERDARCSFDKRASSPAGSSRLLGRRNSRPTAARRVVGMCDSNSGDHDGESGRAGADTRPTGRVQRFPGITVVSARPGPNRAIPGPERESHPPRRKARNPAAIGLCGRWQDPDSNRGHHDFSHGPESL
jgi:hypothetical protein